MPSHYLITASKQAIGVTATSEADAMRQAADMGIAHIVVRVDRAMTQAEWNASRDADETTPVKPVPVKTVPARRVSGFSLAFHIAMCAAKVSLVSRDFEGAISATRLALKSANHMRCAARKRVAFRVLNWLRAAQSRAAYRAAYLS